MPPILPLLGLLILVCLIFWAVPKILGAFGVGEPISTVIWVILVVVVVLWGVSMLFGGPGISELRWR